MHEPEIKFHDWAVEGDSGRSPIEAAEPADDGGFVGIDMGFEDPEPVEEPATLIHTQRVAAPETRRKFPKAAFAELAAYAGAAALAIGIVGGVVFDIAESDGGKSKHRAVPAVCAAPSPAALRQVDILFNGQAVDDDAYDAATANGLHLSNSNSSDFDNETIAKPSDVERVLSEVNQDLEQYGINIQPGTLENGGKLLFGFQNPSPAEFAKSLQLSLEAITRPLFAMPIELARLTGVKDIILMANPKSQYAFYLEGTHTIVWNISSSPYAHEMTEALSEGLDEVECGSGHINQDPSYARLNGRYIYGTDANHQDLRTLGQFTYTDDSDPNVYHPNVSQVLIDSDPTVAAARQAGNYVAYCQALSTANHQITVTEKSDFESVAEDKVDLEGSLLSLNRVSGADDYYAVLNPASPVLRDKAEFLLARLYSLSPKTVRYMAAITSRPSSDPDCP